MKPALEKVKNELYFFDDDGNKHDGQNPDMTGDCSGLAGNCTGLAGNCSGLRGDCSGIWGDCSGIWGNCTGLRGDLDDCQITVEERSQGVEISTLVKQEAE